MSNQKFVTRKDLARILEVSPESVGLNEKQLGLDKARCDLNQRVVKYDAKIADRELVRRGHPGPLHPKK